MHMHACIPRPKTTRPPQNSCRDDDVDDDGESDMGSDSDDSDDDGNDVPRLPSVSTRKHVPLLSHSVRSFFRAAAAPRT